MSMRLLRRILFYAGIVVYLISCPLTVLYALGYLVEPGADQRLVKTGLVAISTMPSGASVHLGKSRYTRTTPTILRDLLPGTYPIRVTLKDHLSWTQQVVVEAEKATVIERVLLVPTSWHVQTVLAGPFDSLTPLPGSHAIVLGRGPRVEDLVVLRYRTGSVKRAEVPEALAGARVRTLLADGREGGMLFDADAQGAPRWLWLEPRAKRAVIEDVTEALGSLAPGHRWEATDDRQAVFLRDGTLSRIDLGGDEPPLAVSGVLGFGVRNRRVLALDQQLRVWRLNDDAGHREVTQPAGFREALAGARGPIRLIPVTRELWLALSADGALVANRPPYRLIDKGVAGVQVDAEQERALVWQPHRLAVIEADPLAGDDGLTVRWIFEQGQSIGQALWLYDGPYVLLRDGEQLLVLDGRPSQQAYIRNLPTVRRGSQVLYAESQGVIYFLDEGSGSLCAVELVPRRSVAFPEPAQDVLPLEPGG